MSIYSHYQYSTLLYSWNFLNTLLYSSIKISILCRPLSYINLLSITLCKQYLLPLKKTKSCVLNFCGTFVWYKSTQKVTWSKWTGTEKTNQHEVKGKLNVAQRRCQHVSAWPAVTIIYCHFFLNYISLACFLQFSSSSLWLMIAGSKITVTVISIYCHLLLFTSRYLSIKCENKAFKNLIKIFTVIMRINR